MQPIMKRGLSTKYITYSWNILQILQHTTIERGSGETNLIYS